ncbi:hypothetical protein J1C48_02230 [Jiella sp. CQZ9-1]|uniref:Uncharacterized protein n=1 Tax=Jiella flava TaxID=2816857 RepID=A0A939FXL2_9HYPH|nr:hypothetical protein [Jiella flava]
MGKTFVEPEPQSLEPAVIAMAEIIVEQIDTDELALVSRHACDEQSTAIEAFAENVDVVVDIGKIRDRQEREGMA